MPARATGTRSPGGDRSRAGATEPGSALACQPDDRRHGVCARWRWLPRDRALTRPVVSGCAARRRPSRAAGPSAVGSGGHTGPALGAAHLRVRAPGDGRRAGGVDPDGPPRTPRDAAGRQHQRRGRRRGDPCPRAVRAPRDDRGGRRSAATVPRPRRRRCQRLDPVDAGLRDPCDGGAVRRGRLWQGRAGDGMVSTAGFR